MALKYLEIGANRVIHVNEAVPLIVGYYCNYAEALFHCGQVKRAVEIAKKAKLFAQSQPPRIRNYAENFCDELLRDARRKNTDIDVNDGSTSSWKKWLPL